MTKTAEKESQPRRGSTPPQETEIREKPARRRKASPSRKEIDKELMYRKIMPSGLGEIRAEEGLDGEPLPDAGNVQPTFTPAAVPSIPGFKAPEPHRVAVPAMENSRMDVVNLMEVTVLEKLDELIERFSCCQCDRCKKDIVALALDKLPPKYVVLSEGQAVPEVDAQTNAQIISAMIQAVLQVRAHPRH